MQAEIEKALRVLGSPERAVQEKAYLKSDLLHLGIPVPEIRRTVVAELRRAKPSREETTALAAALWNATDDGVPVHEFRIAAIEALVREVKSLTSEDLGLAERLIRDSHTWAYVDALAEKVVGSLLLRDYALAATLDVWVTDPDFWIRRTSLLALLPGIRSNQPDLDRLAHYGDLLIDEREFFIRKALGWVLRELSKRDPTWVAAWVADRIPAISGVTIREAVRHLPGPVRADLLTAYRTR